MFSVLGDIKIMSQSHSLHPLTNHSAAVNSNISQSTNQGAGAAGSTNQRPGCQMQSLPDLTEMTTLRRPVNMMTMSRQPEIQRMSPIQILFNDSGQYFVNFNMNNQNK